MGAKLKSKTHLQNMFFDFLSRFLRVWLQSLKKVLIWLFKKIFGKNQKGVKKRRISRWFQIPWKSCEKMFLLITFFWCTFSKLFQRIRNQRKILHFLAPFLFKKKNCFGHISTFFKLWLQMRRKRLKITENLFLWMYLII